MLALAAGSRKGLMNVVFAAAGAEAGLRSSMAACSDAVGFGKQAISYGVLQPRA